MTGPSPTGPWAPGISWERELTLLQQAVQQEAVAASAEEQVLEAAMRSLA